MNPQRQTNEEADASSSIRPNLRALEGGGETSAPTGSLHAVDDPDEGAESPANLRALEGGGETSEPRRGHLRAVQDSETAGGALGAGGQTSSGDTVGKGFAQSLTSGAKNNLGAKVGKFFFGSRGRKIGSGIFLGTSLIGLLFGGSLFSFLNIFSLDHYVSNIESKAFIRYQVDMDGRSTKWISAYMVLRLAEISDPSVSPENRDNLLFRADRVDNNKPLTDWYRTMRTSKFEQEVFIKQNIKFTSVAYRDLDGRVRFRPAQVSINGENTVMGPLTQAETAAIERGDVSQLNGRLRQMVDVKLLGTDKEARREIKTTVNENTRWWQWLKRIKMRHDIQNMTGVRSWKFFETTRNNLGEKTIDVRNRLIRQSLPESTRSGKIVQCLFGIISCKSSPDIADPVNRVDTPVADGNKNGESSSSDDGKTTSPIDPDGGTETIVGDSITEALDNAAADTTKSITLRISEALLKKLNLATGIVDGVDSLSRIDESIRNGSLANMVTVARGTQATAMFTTISVARDQLREGDSNSNDVNDFMNVVSGIGNNQLWDQVIASEGSVKNLGAISNSKYCSLEHQAQLKPAEYAQQCEATKIGGASNAAEFTKWWEFGPLSPILGPVLSAYRGSLGHIVGPIIDFISDVVGTVLSPLLSGVLQLTGLQDNVQAAMAYLVATVSQMLGAGPMYSTLTGPIVGLIGGQGASYTAESSMRYQGASLTTGVSKAEAQKNIALYTKEDAANTSWAGRYLAMDNPDSLLSRGLFSVVGSPGSNRTGAFMTTLFSSLIHLPSHLFNPPSASAATGSGYVMANFAGIQTYDFPKECLDSNPMSMTPQSATNADDLGVIPAGELTWDLVNNKEGFYDRIYAGNPTPETAQKIYNCALLDVAVKQSMGAQYGYGSTSIDDGRSSAAASGAASGQGYVLPIDPKKVTSPVTRCWQLGTASQLGHTGVDLLAPSGTPILAAKAGVVVQAGPGGDAGNYVMIKHDDGYFTSYQHMSAITTTVGKAVKPNEQIGLVGSTGISSTPHLHFSVTTTQTLASRHDTTGSIDPLPFIPTAGLNVKCSEIEAL